MIDKQLLGVFVVGLSIPFLVNWGVGHYCFKSNGNESDWIGFWGSYLGGIFTLLALMVTISSEKKRSDKADREFKQRVEIDAILADMDKVPEFLRGIKKIEADIKANHTKDDIWTKVFVRLARMQSTSNSQRLKSLFHTCMREAFMVTEKYKALESKNIDTGDYNNIIFALSYLRDDVERLNISDSDRIFEKFSNQRMNVPS